MDVFVDLFSRFFWLIFPILGMGLGALAIWTDHRRQMKSLEILRVYAEQGKDPPQSMVDALPQMIGTSRRLQSRGAHLAQGVLLLVLAGGFAYLAYRVSPYSQTLYIFLWGFTITAFALAGSGLQQIVLGLTAPRKNDP
jgi:hypothetical protein